MDTVGARGKMQQNQEIMSTDGPHSCSYCHFKCYDNTFQDEDESDDNDQCISTSPMDTIDKSTGALYLMGCTHSMTLSHHGVDELCLSSQTLVESVARAIGTRVQATLFDHSIISSSLHEDIAIACNPGNIFDGYNRESFYEEAFNYVVSQLS